MRTSLVLLLLFATACSRTPPRIVVWIEIDALRADALGCYGNHASGENGLQPSPAIDALAADALRFEHAYATAPLGAPSLESQLSGSWPWEQEPAVARGPRPLLAALHAAGWRSAGVGSEHALGAADVGFERRDASVARATDVVARLLTLADELVLQPGSGLFLGAGIDEPRYPYEQHAGLRFGPDYSGSLKGDEPLPALLAQRATLADADRVFLRGRYQSEVAAVDRAVGELVAALRQRGWYDDALIVLVSDHGEELLDHGSIGHGEHLHEELVHVPWIVKLPAQDAPQRRGAVVRDVVSLIDFSATLLDLLALLPAERAPGTTSHSRSLVPTLRAGQRSERTWVYLHTDSRAAPSDGQRGYQWGVIDAETALKWFVDHGRERPVGHLYNLKHDPFEVNDLARLGGGREAPLLRLRGLQLEPLEGARGAPRVLPEEPWIARPADLDGAGPALREELR